MFNITYLMFSDGVVLDLTNNDPIKVTIFPRSSCWCFDYKSVDNIILYKI